MLCVDVVSLATSGSSQLYSFLALARSNTTMSGKEDQHVPLANNESDGAGKTD